MAFRRTGVGKLALSRQQGSQAEYRKKGEIIEAAQLATLQEQFETFKQNLANFAHKYRKDIKNDPHFRQYFQRMCTQIGVDPIASSKGFWGEMLGMGDFYYELGVQIIEICLLKRAFTGGLMEMTTLLSELCARRSYAINSLEARDQLISEDDVARSLKSLKPLGGHYSIIKLGSRSLVATVPKELNADQNIALETGQETGFLTPDSLHAKLGWTLERAEKTLFDLTEEGFCWIDSYSNPPSYWIMAYFGSV